jgi:acid stress-induced BolA-like protein IbaG/YrbA
MIPDAELSARFLDALRQLPVQDPTIEMHAGDGYHLLATVVSPTFEGMDEFDRQDLVWGHLREHLDMGARARIEFVFTDAPSELIEDTETEALPRVD